MGSGFELEDDNEVTTSINKGSEHTAMRRALGFEADERVDTPQLNDINRVAFSRRCRSKQIPNDGELVDKQFKL